MQSAELINLNKFYGAHVVKDVQLTLQSDEFVVLVGSSACAKTTPLRVFHAGSMEFAVPPRLRKALSNVDGSTARVGIRPERIQLTGGPGGRESFASGTIDLTELPGSEQLVQVRVDDRQITVIRADPVLRLAPGEPVALTFSAEHVHVFNPTSGLGLSRADIAHRPAAETIEIELRPLRAAQ